MGQDKTYCGKTLAVVGEGMASLIFLYDLALNFQKNLTLPFSKIIWASADALAPSCSYWSTALVARHGVKKGLSVLGDELSEAYELSADFYQQWGGPGVEKINLTYFEDDKQSVARRFGQDQLSEVHHGKISGKGIQEEAYLINPEVFLPHLKQQILSLLPMIEYVNEVIVSYDQAEKKLRGLERSFSCDQVFWGVGASRFLAHKFTGKTITGHVLRYDDVDLGQKSFALNIFGKNIIYRIYSSQRVLFVGATTAQDLELFPDAQTLKQQLDKVLSLEEFAFLKKHQPIIWGGPRHKQSKRRPTMHALSPQEFCVAGLYKSGYSLAYLAAQKARPWWQA